MGLKEFKKYGKKDLWDFKGKVSYQTAFGQQTCSVVDVVNALSGVNPVEFVVAFDKAQEDWGFTEALGKYCVELTVDMLSENLENEEDRKWKEDYKQWLLLQLKKLEESQ